MAAIARSEGRPPAAEGPLEHPCVAYAVPPGADPLRAAFARRQFAAPRKGTTPVPPETAGPLFQQVLDTPRSAPGIAYIHVPYCQNHCLFCGFFQNVWRNDASATFVDDVIAEMERLAPTPLVRSAPIAAVYIGGGTPSALLAEDIARLVGAIRTYLPLTDDCEITLEGRTYGFGLDKAQAALDAGANRISIGVQSFDTAVRQRLGRKVSGPEAQAFLSALASLGRAQIGCDLIYGLPGQDPALWRRDVETAIDSGIDGVSIYALNVWPGGPLARAIDGGRLAAPAALSAQAEAYADAAAAFAARGWRQISQAHFAGNGRERNRYNRMTKAGADCLAFGPGAGGSAHGYCWRNMPELTRRAAMVEQGMPPIDGLARMPADRTARFLISGGLEEGALDLAAVEAAAPGFAAQARPLLENWAASQLGTLERARFRTTAAGAFWITTLIHALNAVLALLPPAAEPAR